MNNDPDDIHGFDRALEMALKRLDDPIVSPNNKWWAVPRIYKNEGFVEIEVGTTS